MSRILVWSLAFGAVTVFFFGGCSSSRVGDKPVDDVTHYNCVATQIEYPATPTPYDASLAGTPAPHTIRDPKEVPSCPMSLQQAIQSGLTKSRVLLDLGGTILRAPASVQSTYEVAIQESDPQFGPEAALSAFDAQFSTGLFTQKDDQQYNNLSVGTAGLFWNYSDIWQTTISKRSVAGSQFSINQTIDYARDSNAGDLFPNGAFDVYYEGAIRHPLLRGSGVEFNRIAGPGGQAGVYNGVLIARLRTDISLADFEAGLRDFVSNIENAYWDLYFAYRDLDIRIQARNDALDTWRRIHALNLENRAGGEADKEAQAREQYFRFEEDVQNSLAGRPLEGTRTNNGSQPGTFRALPGLQIAERRLRFLIGLPASDTEMLRPTDEPSTAKVNFTENWPSLVCEALVRREELRKQRWIVKSRELELVAAQNFLQPNLDLVGRYRVRGFGSSLMDSSPGQNYNSSSSTLNFDNAFKNLASGQFNEWQVGAEFSMPFGFREGHSAVRNAELRICQARAYLREGERAVVSELSSAVAEVDRAYKVLQTDTNRVGASKDQLLALWAVYEAKDKKEGFFEVLDAQRRYTEALSRYYQGRVDYAVAVRNVHYEKGTLLEYCDISTAEGAWPDKAYQDAARRERLRGKPMPIDYAFRQPPVVSLGTPSQACATAPAAEPAPQQPNFPPPTSNPEKIPGPPAIPPGETSHFQPGLPGTALGSPLDNSPGVVLERLIREAPPAAPAAASTSAHTVFSHDKAFNFEQMPADLAAPPYSVEQILTQTSLEGSVLSANRISPLGAGPAGTAISVSFESRSPVTAGASPSPAAATNNVLREGTAIPLQQPASVLR